MRPPGEPGVSAPGVRKCSRIAAGGSTRTGPRVRMLDRAARTGALRSASRLRDGLKRMAAEPLLRTELTEFPCRRGKVRDVYDLGDVLAIVATDRISAFDWVMPNGIPGKGQILTAMTSFWLNWLSVPN